MPATDLQTTGYWVSLSEETISHLREAGAWTNDPNNYGPDWPRIRDRVRARDKYTCQVCGAPETARQHDVHHKTPFRAFRAPDGSPDPSQANRLENLTTLCPSCHHKVEQNVRIARHFEPFGVEQMRMLEKRTRFQSEAFAYYKML